MDAGQRRGGSQPTGVAAHDLHHHDHACVINAGVLIDLHHRSGNIFSGRGVTGAVVSAEQVVVNGLGYAHYAALIADGLHIVIDLVAGIHRVVAAVIEEVTNVMLLKHLKDTLIIGVIHLGIGNLITAGAQGRGGGIL